MLLVEILVRGVIYSLLGRKILYYKNLGDRLVCCLKVLKWFLLKNSCLGRKKSMEEENPVGWKTSEFDRVCCFESLEVVLVEKILIGEKIIHGWGKSCWMKNLWVLPGLLFESLEVVLVEKLLLGEKTILGGGNPVWWKTSEFYWVYCYCL